MKKLVSIMTLVLTAMNFNAHAQAPAAPAQAEEILFSLDHVRYIPVEMITKPSSRAKLNEVLKTWARPGDSITYKLEPKSQYKFIGIKYSSHAEQFTRSPVISMGGLYMTITVLPTAPAFETKSTLVVVKRSGGQPIDVDPAIIVQRFF